MAKAKSSKREFYITFFIIVAAYPFSMRENPDLTAALVLCAMFTFSVWIKNVARILKLRLKTTETECGITISIQLPWRKVTYIAGSSRYRIDIDTKGTLVFVCEKLL